MNKLNKSVFKGYWLLAPLMAIMCSSYGSRQPLEVTVSATYSNSTGNVCLNGTGAWTGHCSNGNAYLPGPTSLTFQYKVGDYPSYELIVWGATSDVGPVNASLDPSCSGPPLNGTLAYGQGFPVLTVTVTEATIAKFGYMYQLNAKFDGLTHIFSCSQQGAD
jgi:hypothetical protein